MFEVTIIPDRQMTAEETDQWEAKILHNTSNIGEILLKIREEKGWEAKEFKSFRDYGESLRERMGLSNVYRVVDQADVNRSLTEGLGRRVELPVSHALMLKDLDPAQRVLAFKEAMAGGQPRPTAKVFERAARKTAPVKKKKPRVVEENNGWSKEDLKADPEIAAAFDALSVWGGVDVKAIQKGALSLKRADILFMGKLPKPKLMEIQDLVMGNGWSPQQAVRFLGTMPDKYSTVEDLQNYALATKGKYLTVDIEGFTVTCKANRAALRK